MENYGIPKIRRNRISHQVMLVYLNECVLWDAYLTVSLFYTSILLKKIQCVFFLVCSPIFFLGLLKYQQGRPEDNDVQE